MMEGIRRVICVHLLLIVTPAIVTRFVPKILRDGSRNVEGRLPVHLFARRRWDILRWWRLGRRGSILWDGRLALRLASVWLTSLRDGRREALLMGRRRSPLLLRLLLLRSTPLILRLTPLLALVLVLGRELRWILAARVLALIRKRVWLLSVLLGRILAARVLALIWWWVALLGLMLVLTRIALAWIALLLLMPRRLVGEFFDFGFAFSKQLVEGAGHGVASANVRQSMFGSALAPGRAAVT